MRTRKFEMGPHMLLLLSLALSGCSSQQHLPPPDQDPYENVNRKVFWVNDQLDTHALVPAAKGWNKVVPKPAQRGLHNFFQNLRFPIVLVNDILQGEPRWALETIARFQANTLMGGLGFFDVAADWGVPPHVQDTGLTFARWGIASGPYLVLPFFGPSTPRDAVGLAGDGALTIYPYFITVPWATVIASAVDVVNTRARYLEPSLRAKEAALDYYTFVRNAYIQRRTREIQGKAPSPTDEDLYDEENLEQYLEEGE
ncbi:MAG: VacJ family lipoprotein [Candidatus Binatia bacterium]